MHGSCRARGEDRECEKVMLYILSNVRKNARSRAVASVILEQLGGMFRLKRLMDQLVKRLEERRETLNSRGLELAGNGFFHHRIQCSGRDGLRGLQVLLPLRDGRDACAFPRRSSLEDFLQLIRACKEKSVADRPIMNAPQVHRKRTVTVPSGRS